ncbi:MAG: aldo/keto reductase [Synechococcaceae cyanobacterium RM1_1_27]|nr:aldo/keto reductase [Synechococcaceae cyanobacterium SM2_3_2]NJO86006.1 aldo/keto reductase [Synechococcaceae cyanobacterium RM1_1_27]
MGSDLQLGELVVGCWQLDDRLWPSLSELEVERAIDTYLALGIHSFDTADIYGRSEAMLGRLLKGRPDCLILTKTVFFEGIPSASHIRHKIEHSLRNLHRDQLDCVHVHWQDPSLDCAETFDVLKQLQDQGKINRLGVTNFTTPMLQRVIQQAPIWSHQVQYSLVDRRVEPTMQPFCQKHQIQLLAYGPLAGGYLSSAFHGRSTPTREGSHARGFFYSSMIEEHGGWAALQQLLNTLAQIADKTARPISQIALNWVRQQPGVRAVVLGLTLDRLHIKSNAEALTWSLDPEDIAYLAERSAALFRQDDAVYSYERARG